MSYIELKNDKYETLEDLKRLLHYILRLDKTAEDSQRANTITNTLAGCQPAMIPNEYLCDPSAVYIRFSMTTGISSLLSRKSFWNMKRC